MTIKERIMGALSVVGQAIAGAAKWMATQGRLTFGALGVLGAAGGAFALWLWGRKGAQKDQEQDQLEASVARVAAEEKAKEQANDQIGAIDAAHPGDSGARQRLLDKARAVSRGGTGGC
jgi:hypothetical protein